MSDLDKLLNRVAALSHVVGSELEDLLTLAYEKSSAVQEERVSGGSIVVDLHSVGDPRARTVLSGLEKYSPLLIEHLDNALNLLHAKGPLEKIPRTRKQISKTEHEHALQMQEKRKARGEYTPVKNEPQPGIY